ncbi:hypothetical protein SUGI_0487790 [Cryptomeria japonica]|nr:hypothetical protein SUGI_0487790 [Cryptomeria japonica]
MKLMICSLSILLVFVVYFMLVLGTDTKVKACPPSPSMQCTSDECEIFNYHDIWENHSICKAGSVAWPTSEPQPI